MTWWKVWTAPRAEGRPDGSVVFRPERSILGFVLFVTLLLALLTAVNAPNVDPIQTMASAAATTLMVALLQWVAGRSWLVGLGGLVSRHPFGRRWDRSIGWSEVTGVRTVNYHIGAVTHTLWDFTANRDGASRIRIPRNRFMPKAQKAFVDAVSARLETVGKERLAERLRRDLTWSERKDRRRLRKQRRDRKEVAA